MKLKINIFPICLAIFIFIFSVLQCSILAYASEGVYPSGTSTLEKVLTEASSYLVYLATRVEAIVDGDFAKWVQNREDYIEYWNTGHISYDEKTDSVTFSDDLVKYIKQALKEYAEENMGFWVVPTTNFSRVSASNFTYAAAYKTMKNIVREKEIVFTKYTSNFSRMEIYDIYSTDKGFVPVCNSDTFVQQGWEPSGVNAKNGDYFTLYDENWIQYKSTVYYLFFSNGYEEFQTYSDFCESASSTGNSGFSFGFSPSTYNVGFPYGTVFTSDGRNIRAFKSLNAYKNYDGGTRPVYFGSKYYEDPGTVTVSVDDLEGWMDKKYDGLIDDFRDVIGDETVSEDELEKILQDFLDKFFERLGESGGGSGSGGGISSAVTEWLEKIYGKLKDIEKVLKKIKNWTILDTLFDAADAIADWLDLIHDIISDVDSGAESAVKTLSSALDDSMGLMKKKFPFSVPWDILFFVTLFSAEPETPYFEVPIDFTVSSLGPDSLIEIHYDFVIDFAGYQYLSDIFRTVLSMIYAVGLIKLTPGIVTTNKEE